MSRALQRVQRFYQIQLGTDERIEGSSTGYAGGTGRLVAVGMIGGMVLGWVYAVLAESPSLPSLVFGAFVGIVAGYWAAERSARGSGGPGATTFTILVTTQRLLFLKNRPALRPSILRSLERGRITTMTMRQLPVGLYHRYEITTTEGTVVAFVTIKKLDIEPVNALPTSR